MTYPSRARAPRQRRASSRAAARCPEASVPGMQSSVSVLHPRGVRGCRHRGLRDRWSTTEAGIAEKSSTAVLSGIYTCDIAANLVIADVVNYSLKR